MKDREKLTQLEYEAIDLKILFNALFDVVKYQEMEEGRLTSVQCLCEIMDERFSKLMTLF